MQKIKNNAVSVIIVRQHNNFTSNTFVNQINIFVLHSSNPSAGSFIECIGTRNFVSRFVQNDFIFIGIYEFPIKQNNTVLENLFRNNTV